MKFRRPLRRDLLEYFVCLLHDILMQFLFVHDVVSATIVSVALSVRGRYHVQKADDYEPGFCHNDNSSDLQVDSSWASLT